jgi:hypothetical protein
MLASYYRHRMSIVLQRAQVIVILQQVDALGWVFLLILQKKLNYCKC